jgi:hypothetical protein
MNMRRFSLTHVRNLRRNAREAYHEERWERDFEAFWDAMIVYRMDAPVPFAGYWDAIKMIQQCAWEDEASADAVGK